MSQPTKHTMVAIAEGTHRPPIFLKGKHPRKELMDILQATHADSVFCDKADGTTVLVGYVIRRIWYTLFHITRMEKPR